MNKTLDHARFSVAYYSGNRKTGTLTRVRCEGGEVMVTPLPTEPESALDKPLKPVLVGMSEDGRVILLDPRSKQIRFETRFPADAFPAHIYQDPQSTRAWFMNDGDKETGNDTLNCGDRGSSVTVIDHIDSSRAQFVKTICAGRGHHQAAFTFPSPQAPQVPRRAYISSLNDGTVSVLGNDPNDVASYLQVINAIKERLPFKGDSNLFASPLGRYLIGRGADRKSDPEHVIGKLAVWDVVDKRVVDELALPDVYLSKYYYNVEGSKLYFTTGSSGSPEQQKNLKTDVLLVLDMTALPRLKLLQEMKVGASGSLAFHDENGRTRWVFSSDSEGALVIIDGERDTVAERIALTAGPSHSRVWSVSA